MFLVSEQLTTAVQIQTCIYYLIKLKSPYGEENLHKKSTKYLKKNKKSRKETKIYTKKVQKL